MARLLEFYLLLRAGVPDIASHILSNHYNNTRDEYYRQLQKATTTEATEELQEKEKKNENIIRRIRQLAYYLPADKFIPVNEIKTTDIHISKAYEGFTRPTLKSDLDLLVKHHLLVEQEGTYRSNQETLRSFLPGSSADIARHF
jgi:hypothetical protein